MARKQAKRRKPKTNLCKVVDAKLSGRVSIIGPLVC